MDDKQIEFYDNMVARYETDEIPWDDPEPPPEVVTTMSSLMPGRALDLGCGFGRASIFMAAKGWQVDGVDFIPRAIATARERAVQANQKVSFHLAHVTNLDFLDGQYDFALDVGCCHSLDEESLKIYRDHLARLLKPGATYLLFSRLRVDEDPNIESGPQGLTNNQITELFDGYFELEWQSKGETDVPGQQTWASGWYRWRRSS